MSDDGADEAPPMTLSAEAEIHQLIGLFDAPAFVRRGQEVEQALVRIRQRLAREREAMLDMVRLRLRQWAAVATGADDWADTFTAPVAPLVDLANASGQVAWSGVAAPSRRRRAVGRDLAASVARFNRRWTQFLGRLSFETLNRQIDHYNRYYVLEKECVLGSARLAARHFVPRPRLTPESLLAEFPALPVPGLAG